MLTTEVHAHITLHWAHEFKKTNSLGVGNQHSNTVLLWLNTIASPLSSNIIPVTWHILRYV